jgi:hypothetical protein
MVCQISLTLTPHSNYWEGVKKRLEAQTTAQIQDEVTNNFTIHKKLLELFGMHLILED